MAQKKTSSNKRRRALSSAKSSGHSAKIFIEKRIEPQLDFLNRKAHSAKVSHYTLLTISILATSLIVVANFLDRPIVSTILAVAAAAATGLMSVGKFHTHWVRYRKTVTSLEALKLRYEMSAAPFEKTSNRDKRFIEYAESILSDEQNKWAEDTTPSQLQKRW